MIDEVRRHPEADAAARARVAHETHSGGGGGGGGGGAVRGGVDCRRRGGRRRRGLLGRIVKLPAKNRGLLPLRGLNQVMNSHLREPNK